MYSSNTRISGSWLGFNSLSVINWVNICELPKLDKKSYEWKYPLVYQAFFFFFSFCQNVTLVSLSECFKNLSLEKYKQLPLVFVSFAEIEALDLSSMLSTNPVL